MRTYYFILLFLFSLATKAQDSLLFKRDRITLYVSQLAFSELRVGYEFYLKDRVSFEVAAGYGGKQIIYRTIGLDNFVSAPSYQHYLVFNLFPKYLFNSKNGVKPRKMYAGILLRYSNEWYKHIMFHDSPSGLNPGTAIYDTSSEANRYSLNIVYGNISFITEQVSWEYFLGGGMTYKNEFTQIHEVLNAPPGVPDYPRSGTSKRFLPSVKAGIKIGLRTV